MTTTSPSMDRIKTDPPVIGELTDSVIFGHKGEKDYKGGKITAPGIYRHVPIDVYHSDCCDAPSVSSSILRQVAPPDGCPLKAWDACYLNPDRAPDEQKDHFSLGRAVHTLLLGEDGFRDDYVIRPTEWKDWKTAASRDWRAAQVMAGKTVLVPDNIEQIEGMANRVANDQTFIDHLRGRIERSVIHRDRTGLYVKARPDSIPHDTIVADLKTTADASERGCLNSIKKFGYHMQMALIGTALEGVTGQRVTDFVLLFIETKRPYAYNIKPIDQQYIWLGMRQNRAALDIFAHGLSTGDWQTYFSNGITACPSEFFEKQIDNEPSIPAEAA